MWLLRWLVIAIVFVLMLYFGFQNSSLTVEGLWVGREIPPVPLLLALLAAFLLGMVVMFFIASVEYFKMQARVRGVRKDHDRMTEQLQGFQRIPLDEIDEALTSDTGSSGEGAA
jgi:uncharacterized integral membrane protein